jgi:hypothetical protein
MPNGSRYREYAEECLRSAQGATPVQRAHLLRVARTWFEIADQTDAWDGDDAAPVHQATNRQPLMSDQAQKKVF